LQVSSSVKSWRHKSKPLAVHADSDYFGGARFFAEAILQDLSPTMAERLNRCNFNLQGSTDSSGIADDISRSNKSQIWLLVEVEDLTGNQVVSNALARMGPSDRVVVLGNLWDANDNREVVRGERFTSMWAPWATLHFAERKSHTPMDLLHRERIRSHARRSGTVAYMQSDCIPYRDYLFDIVTETLHKAGQPASSALGTCKGYAADRRRQGYRNRLLECKKGYDESVARYHDYHFALALEHLANSYGYITEKPLNAFLAGAIPVAHGNPQMAVMFNPASFIHVNVSDEKGLRDGAAKLLDVLLDQELYDRIQKEPVVSEQSLKKFFSWHPAVWKTHGDDMRMSILNEVLHHCDSIDHHKDEEKEPPPKAYVFRFIRDQPKFDESCPKAGYTTRTTRTGRASTIGMPIGQK